MSKIRVIQYGLGATGSMIARFALAREWLTMVGAVDVAEDKVGRDLGEVLGFGRKLGVTVSSDPDAVFNQAKADVVLHATATYVPDVWSQISRAVQAKTNVITIAEEMSYPQIKYPALAKEIDEAAKKQGVVVLGTGVNPGFAMDLHVLFICGICQEVRRIKVSRLVDFSPFPQVVLEKLGIGLTAKKFQEKFQGKNSKLPFIGLVESMNMITDGLGWKLDDYAITVEPVLTENYIKTLVEIEPGQVYGFNQRCTGIKGGREVIILEELGRVGPGIEARNTIMIEGLPNVTESMSVPPSDVTTAAHVVNLIPQVLKAKPGLLNMRDMHQLSLVR